MTDSHLPTIRCGACRAAICTGDRFCSECGASTGIIQSEVLEGAQDDATWERRRLGGTGWLPDTPNENHGVSEIYWTATAPAPSAKKTGRHHRRSRLIRILMPFTVSLAIVAGGLAGRGLSETGSTIDKLQQVSTPPAQITDQTVISDAEGESIPDQIAVNISSEPASNSESQTSGVSESDNAVPGHTIDAEQPAAVEIPAPDNPVTGLPQASSIEQDSSTGLPEASSEQDSSTGLPQESSSEQNSSTVSEDIETGTVSISDSSSPGDQTTGDAAPPDAPDGETLAAQQMAAGKTFDTSPAQEAIVQAQQAGGEEQSDAPASDGDEGLFGSILDRGSEVRDTAQGAAIAAGIAEPSSQPLTIMIMGVDAREGSAIDIGVRPDALMVLRLDPQAGTCNGLAIPRDSWVELPGYGKTKINHALMLGGIPYQQLVVENYLGLEIDHYALIDFTGFAELVDSVGGVTIDVPPELASPAVDAGTVTITGDQALQHARYRGSGMGDFDRIKRQQQIMRGLIDAAGGRDLLSEANRLLAGLSDHIRTDMDIDQLASMAKLYQDRCTVDGLTMSQIPGEVVYGPIIDPLFNLPLSYVVSDPAVVEEMVLALLEQ